MSPPGPHGYPFGGEEQEDPGGASGWRSGFFQLLLLGNLLMAQPAHLEDEVETYWRKGQWSLR